MVFLCNDIYMNLICFGNTDMTQDERCQKRYEEVVVFVESNRRSPSCHRIEEHDFLNWMKANIKVMNAGKIKPDREV